MPELITLDYADPSPVKRATTRVKVEGVIRHTHCQCLTERMICAECDTVIHQGESYFEGRSVREGTQRTWKHARCLYAEHPLPSQMK